MGARHSSVILRNSRKPNGGGRSKNEKPRDDDNERPSADTGRPRSERTNADDGRPNARLRDSVSGNVSTP